MSTITAATRESWWTRTVHQLVGRASSQPTAHTDQVSLSGRRPVREELASQASRLWGGLRAAVTHPSQAIESLARGGSRLLQGASDFVGCGAAIGLHSVGRAEGALLTGMTHLTAKGLDLAGAPGAAARLRHTGAQAARAVERTQDQTGKGVSNFVSGVGDGAGGLVEGIGTAVAHPLHTAQGLQRLAQVVDPVSQVRAAVLEGKGVSGVLRENAQTLSGIVDGVRQGYEQTGKDHGTAGQVGRAVFDVVTTVATGGESAAARVGIRSSANLLDDFARASRAAAAGGEVTGQVSRLARASGEFVGKRLEGPLGPLAERITGAAESGSQALVRRSERISAENLARGQQRAGQSGAIPGVEGAEVLGPARQRANALGKRFQSNEQQFRAGGAEREALLSDLPASTQQRVREFNAAGREDEALELLQRHHVDEAVRASLQEAAQVDRLHPTVLPPEVDSTRVLAQGRQSSLEFLLNDANLPAEGVRRNFRHIVGDSDITGPVFIQEFRAGDKVGRAFSSSAGRETGITSESGLGGNYFGSVSDAQLSRRQIQQFNAVGLDNHADLYASLTLPQDTYGVVSRIGEQFSKYGEHAAGGGLQYTFPGRVKPLDPIIQNVSRLSESTRDFLDSARNATIANSLTPSEEPKR